jgi:hypothetical protein
MPLTVQGRQLLAGSGDVTLRGQNQPGPAAGIRLGLAGTRRSSPRQNAG